MKNILIISYYFAPYGGGGVIRIHNFVKYLPDTGYRPRVLTVQEKYYANTYRTPELLKELSPETRIFRTKCLEPSQWGIKDKIFGIRPRKKWDHLTLGLLKHLLQPWLIPDRNITWLLPALKMGRRIISSQNIRLIFATSPPFTSNLIAYLLSAGSRIPYVVDYRDDWVGNPVYSSRFALKQSLEKQLEKTILRKSSLILSTTEESRALFKIKCPDLPPNKLVVLPNGFDPEYFSGITGKKEKGDRITFTYTGSLTPKRNPDHFLQAFARFALKRSDWEDKFEIRFIGFMPQATKDRIQAGRLRKIIRCQSKLTPRQVAGILRRETDVCLLFQTKANEGQTAIPGKVYEYLAARKPILCLAEGGATVRFLKEIGCELIADYQDTDQILDLIKKVVSLWENDKLSFCLRDHEIERFSRKKQVERLAQLFNGIPY